MDKTPKNKSKSKNKLKKGNSSLRNIHNGTNKKNKQNKTVNTSPKTMNYSKVIKKYGDILDENNSPNDISKESNMARNTSYYQKPKEEMTGMFNIEDLNPESQTIPCFNKNNDKGKEQIPYQPLKSQSQRSTIPQPHKVSNDTNNKHLVLNKDLANNKLLNEYKESMNDKENCKCQSTHCTNNNNNNNNQQLNEKITIMLKLFKKYANKLTELINLYQGGNDNDDEDEKELFNEIKQTITSFYNTVNNEKLSLMFNIKHSPIREKIYEDNDNNQKQSTQRGLVKKNKINDQNDNKILISDYEKKLSKLNKQNDLLQQTVEAFERKDKETQKNIKQKEAIAQDEMNKLKSTIDKLTNTNTELQSKVQILKSNDSKIISQNDIIIKLKEQISVLETDIKLKDSTIAYLQKTFHKLRFNSNIISNEKEENPIKNSDIYELPRKITQVDSSNQNSNAFHHNTNNTNMQKENEESIIMYGSNVSLTNQHKANKSLEHNDLGLHLNNTNRNYKSIHHIDNELHSVLSSHNSYNPIALNQTFQKHPEIIQKEIDVLDQEIVNLKSKLKMMITTNK